MTYITNDVVWGGGGTDSYTMYNGLDDNLQRFFVANYAFWIHLSTFRKMVVFHSNIKATKTSISTVVLVGKSDLKYKPKNTPKVTLDRTGNYIENETVLT